MSFEEYLASKKIDSNAYKVAEGEQWVKFSAIFEQMHPKSFTLQKLNLINGIRRRFPYKIEEVEHDQIKVKIVRPMMKPKTQPVVETSSDAIKKAAVRSKVSVAKPKMGKPVMPKVSKPVMKPKMKTDLPEENKDIAKPKSAMKPKMARPAIKSTTKNN